MVDTKTIEWKERRKNVYFKSLARDEYKKFQIDIVKLEPKTEYKEHSHPDVEWVYVLKGSLTDERGTFSKGHFIVNEKGSKHIVTTGSKGAELIVCWCGRVDE